jgi:hypothetical protein
MKNCEMTVSDNGKKTVDGHSHYWVCGKPARATIKNRPRSGRKYVCGIHAKANDRLADKYKHIEKSKPLAAMPNDTS